MTDITHNAAELLTGPVFYDYEHFIVIEGVEHKVTAVHMPDTSTAHYWSEHNRDDILLSVRPLIMGGLGTQIKHMVSPATKLRAKLGA